MHKKTENTQPVIHETTITPCCVRCVAILPLPPKSSLRRILRHKSTPSPAASPRGFRRNPHIQRQTILAAASVAKIHVAINVPLHTVRAKLRGLTHARPFRRGHGRLPAQIAHRRRGIRDSKKRRTAPSSLPSTMPEAVFTCGHDAAPNEAARRISGQHSRCDHANTSENDWSPYHSALLFE